MSHGPYFGAVVPTGGGCVVVARERFQVLSGRFIAIFSEGRAHGSDSGHTTGVLLPG